MEAMWVLVYVIFTSSGGVATEKIPFASRDLCVGAKSHMVTNFQGRTDGDVIRAACYQTRRNTPS